MTNHILRRLYVTGPLNALAITCLTAGCFLFAADKVISICMFSDVTSVMARGMSGNGKVNIWSLALLFLISFRGRGSMTAPFPFPIPA